MKDNIFFLSGLPRTGSTLLTSILSQNPDIHTEGNSALCQLMWDMQVSCWNTEQINNKPEIANKLLNRLPEIFYEGISNNIIDKCRSWTLPANLELIDKYITHNPKIIVMLRPIVDIVKSFIYVRKMNGWDIPEEGLLDEGSEPIMRSLDGVRYAQANNDGKFLFVQYDDLISNPSNTIKEIYDFCDWKPYDHDYNNIINKSPEKDDIFNLLGLHDIRPSISRRELNVTLSQSMLDKALSLS